MSKTFNFRSVLSAASMELFVTKLKKVQVPKVLKIPDAKAAVLVPFCPIEDHVCLLYTVRSLNLRNHTGQISFPGGKVDKGENMTQTALRETKEEIGINPNSIKIWGEAPHVPGRSFKIMITPVIGSIENIEKEKIQVNTKEVSEVLVISLKCLCDPENQFHTQYKNGYILPVFVVNNYKIWGITAYITHLILECLLPKEVYFNEWSKKKIDL